MHTILARRQRYCLLLLSLLLHTALLILLLCTVYDFDNPLRDMSRTKTGSDMPATVHFVGPGDPAAPAQQRATQSVAPPQQAQIPTTHTAYDTATPDTKDMLPARQHTPRPSVPPVDEPQVEQRTKVADTVSRASKAPLVSQPTSGDYARTKAVKQHSLAHAQRIPASAADALSMANIARAFGAAGTHDGQSGQGGVSGPIDPEAERRAIALHRYRSKVFSWLQQSFRGHYRLIHLCKDLNTKCQMVMSFAKDGTFIDLKINHPHKSQELKEVEAILLRTAQVAGLFPKIPASLQTDHITLAFDFGVNVQEGFHPYDLLYR